MKKFLLLFLTILMAGINANAAVGDSFVYEGLEYLILEDSETNYPKVSVSASADKPTGDLVIPSQVPIPDESADSHKIAEVVKISRAAFNYCSDMITVKIPDSVIEIEDYAFRGCKNLISAKIPVSVTKIGVQVFQFTSLENYVVDKNNAVYESIDGIIYQKEPHILVAFPPKKAINEFIIPDSVTRIEDYAFSDCIDLTSVTIPESVTEIGEEAFGQCSSLTSLTIPASVTEIGKAAFFWCQNLTSINIPDSVTKIEPSVFNGCNNLTSIIIPDYVTEIGDSAFGDCSSLTSLTIPDSVTKIGKEAFSKCFSLTSINIPDSVTKIESYVFNQCYKLTSIIIPESVTEIGDYAFYYCTGLTSVIIPESVTIIGNFAFEKCEGLTSITIPASVTKIGAHAFGVYDSNDDNLKTIYTYSIEPPLIVNNAFYNRKNAVVYVPKGSVEAYKAADGWSQFADIREMGVVELSLSSVEISIEKGESETVTATVNKGEDVTIESESWSSSNPEVATVENGVVTAVSKGDAAITYAVTDNYGETHTATCLVSVSDMTGIESVDADSDAIEVEYFNMNGVRVEKERLLPGIYIKRQSEKTTKVMVK